MQVARLVFPSLRAFSPWQRKLMEPFVALALRARWGFRGVEESWLNLVPLPGGVEGLPAAAKLHFGARGGALAQLPLADIDALIAHAPRPGSAAARAWVAARQAERTSGIEKPDVLASGVSFQVPHLLQSLLEGRLPGHLSPSQSARGQTFQTHINAALQADIEKAARGELARLRGRNANNVAVLVVDNATANVIAYLGNVTRLPEPDARSAPEKPWVDNVVSFRQAGSTLKPFLYALAFEKRYITPKTQLLDTPYERAKPQGTYRPRNYDLRFQGSVSAESALANSRNVPAVRVLDVVGVPAFAARLEALTIPVGEAPELYGESLALGTLDVTLWHLVQAYVSLARAAWLPEAPRTPARLVAFPAQAHSMNAPALPVFRSPESAQEVARILSSNTLRASSFGLDSPLATPFETAVKTGTSVDMRDNWCLGFTPQHTVGVWVGNADGEPMWDVSGVEGAAPLWRDVMERLQTFHNATEGAQVLRAANFAMPLAASEPHDTLEQEPLPSLTSRVLVPTEGSIFTRDPGIPSEVERIVFSARVPKKPRSTPFLNAHRLHLNGSHLSLETLETRQGNNALVALWPPSPGRHRLALVDSDGREVDAVTFLVK
jgi:penicillin-binding protein 1C